MRSSEYYSGYGFPVPRQSCVTTPARRVEWPPQGLLLGQMLFTLMLFLLDAGLVASVAAALVLLVGDVLAVRCAAGTLRGFASRLLAVAGAEPRVV